MADNTLNLLLDLDPAIQPTAFRFINLGRQYGFPVVVTSGRRTVAEQQRLVAAGRSTTMKSKHLEGLAFDIDMYGWNRDSVPSWVWWDWMGPMGEQIGLRWGGRWSTFVDVGHFEI